MILSLLIDILTHKTHLENVNVLLSDHKESIYLLALTHLLTDALSICHFKRWRN